MGSFWKSGAAPRARDYGRVGVGGLGVWVGSAGERGYGWCRGEGDVNAVHEVPELRSVVGGSRGAGEDVGARRGPRWVVCSGAGAADVELAVVVVVSHQRYVGVPVGRIPRVACVAPAAVHAAVVTWD